MKQNRYKVHHDARYEANCKSLFQSDPICLSKTHVGLKLGMGLTCLAMQKKMKIKRRKKNIVWDDKYRQRCKHAQYEL